MRRTGRTWIGAGAWMACCAGASARQVSFEFLQAPWQQFGSTYNWVSSDGTAAVGTTDSSITRWTAAGGYEDRGPGTGVFGADFSTVVLGRAESSYPAIFLVSQTGEVTNIGSGTGCAAFGLSSDGGCVLYTYDVTGGEGFYFLEAWGDCPVTGGTGIYAISDDAKTYTGYFRVDYGQGSFYYGPGVYATDGGWAIGWGGWGLTATAISRDGRIVAGIRTSAQTSLRQYYTLTDLLGWRAYAFEPYADFDVTPLDVSSDGQMMRLFLRRSYSEKRWALWSRTRGLREINALVRPLGIIPGEWWISELADMTSDGLTFVGTARLGSTTTRCGFRMTLPRPCAADMDWDWAVGDHDMELFVERYLAADEKADIDGNGVVDTDDFDAFVRAFEGGC